MPFNRSDNPSYITKMPDGTIKQFNPFTSTEVWTIPGRADKRIDLDIPDAKPITDDGHTCIFCPERILETPPEKSRVIKEKNGDTSILHTASIDDLPLSWEFRRIPHIHEIVPYSYWQKNYRYEMSHDAKRRMESYMSDPAGKSHLLSMVKEKILSSGATHGEWENLSERERLQYATSFFGGSHDVIIARRHYTDNARNTHDIASAGTLTPGEHSGYIELTIDAMHDLYSRNRYAKYVQVFQNWRRGAGASIDHLHKQLVAIDERPVQARREIPLLRNNPNMYNEDAVDYAAFHNLVIAENEHAIAVVGFGHRYPTLEVWSRSSACQPWEHSSEERRAMSDLIHAMHAATGALVPTNEEWYTKPIDLDIAMPWHVFIKWRVSTLAGFEGGSKIYVNTIDPYSLRDRIVPQLLELRAEGRIAENIHIDSECLCPVNSLKYNVHLH